jgi:hypothetical protein
LAKGVHFSFPFTNNQTITLLNTSGLIAPASSEAQSEISDLPPELPVRSSDSKLENKPMARQNAINHIGQANR